MVGIGGRSRGCKTCRRARVKCGFNPFPVFIDGLSLNEIKADNATEGDGKKETSLVPAPSLDEDNIFTTHLIMTLFIPFKGSNTVPNPSLSLWLMSSILPSDHPQAPQLAVRACAAAYFGKIHRQFSAAERGTVLYTKALRQLQKQLFDSEQVLKTDTLSATLLLALFEMITSKDMNGWLSHLLGVGHLIKFRGPQAHRDGTGKELFLTTRPSIALFEKLYNWRVKWEQDFSHTYFNVGLDSLKDLNVFELDSYPFPTAIFFTEHIRVAEICIYNAMLLLLHQACRQLPASIRPTVTSYENTYSWPRPSVLLAPGDGSVEDIIGEFCKLTVVDLMLGALCWNCSKRPPLFDSSCIRPKRPDFKPKGALF
ncbi:hypothetical protein TRIATDRAFT_281499 [Trichoderma atroviride IMI 206040]|uniref:Zn(2)-C6 fungal-type domain-containing protein n=1 Tax=Hypocrea atroviridis (strain ATCC 20476 / IMI 206040) TaxID=452589 RepID=G9NLC6_HYPAI|nr:uncharacterized protein TRIATDRAFT_281499 [Trichoderma atroviride IMI 206040]EHK48690.1 hypothetical protein TRIATDRAFT_281499 [Trichoderma atroviride IMI 206040]